jgi:hypothetical protein
MESLLGGTYITPSSRGIRINTTEVKLEHNESSFIGHPNKGSKEGSIQGKLRRPEAQRGACDTTDTWEEHLSLSSLSS